MAYNEYLPTNSRYDTMEDDEVAEIFQRLSNEDIWKAIGYRRLPFSLHEYKGTIEYLVELNAQGALTPELMDEETKQSIRTILEKIEFARKVAEYEDRLVKIAYHVIRDRYDSGTYNSYRSTGVNSWRDIRPRNFEWRLEESFQNLTRLATLLGQVKEVLEQIDVVSVDSVVARLKAFSEQAKEEELFENKVNQEFFELFINYCINVIDESKTQDELKKLIPFAGVLQNALVARADDLDESILNEIRDMTPMIVKLLQQKIEAKPKVKAEPEPEPERASYYGPAGAGAPQRPPVFPSVNSANNAEEAKPDEEENEGLRQKRECREYLRQQGILSSDEKILKKKLRAAQLKYHPNKGGNIEIFQKISNCISTVFGSNWEENEKYFSKTTGGRQKTKKVRRR